MTLSQMLLATAIIAVSRPGVQANTSFNVGAFVASSCRVDMAVRGAPVQASTTSCSSRIPTLVVRRSEEDVLARRKADLQSGGKAKPGSITFVEYIF